MALNNVSGSLSKIINASVSSLMKTINIMEHELDFNDDEISFTSKKENIKNIKNISDTIQKVIASSFLLSAQQEDLRICFAGKTNVGKSSLFNALLGNKRSIISKTAGTTRDAVSEGLKIEGSSVQLVDTAGLRLNAGKIEKKGISKTGIEIQKADILIFVDTKNPLKEFNQNKIFHNNVVFVLSKQDLIKKQLSKKYISTSCSSLFGIKSLRSVLQSKIKKINKTDSSKSRYLLNIRQKKELDFFIKEMGLAIKAFSQTGDLVVVLSYLYRARNSIQSTLRPLEKNDVLNDIFAGFCVGK